MPSAEGNPKTQSRKTKVERAVLSASWLSLRAERGTSRPAAAAMLETHTKPFPLALAVDCAAGRDVPRSAAPE
jgi:hypothetical protein